MERKKIIIIGGVPSPIGGVTVFTQRLTSFYTSYFKEIIDLYYNCHKESSSLPIKFFSKKIGLLKLIWYFAFKVRNPVYFNFSKPEALLFIYFIPKKNIEKKWGLTLHHGDLGSSIKGWKKILRPIYIQTMKKIDNVGYISSSQRDFYRSLGLNFQKLAPVNPFVRTKNISQTDFTCDELEKVINWKREGNKLFIISGIPKYYYQHLETLKVFEELWLAGYEKIKLVGFFYGRLDNNLFKQIKKKFNRFSNAKIYTNMEEKNFLFILGRSDGYIRMNTIDSYGVAVAEALEMNIPVITTNVCERHPLAYTIEPDDFFSVKQFITNPMKFTKKNSENNSTDNNKIFLSRLVE